MNKKRKAVMVMAMFFSVGAASLISAGPAVAMPPNCDFYVCEGQGGGGDGGTPGGGGTSGGGGGGGGAPQPPTPPPTPPQPPNGPGGLPDLSECWAEDLRPPAYCRDY